MGGPSDRQFDLQPGRHVTPIVDYAKFDLDSPAGRRRSVYRFLFRTLPDPFMESLDCPAGDQMTPVRANSVTVQQALAMWNDAFMIRHCEHFAARLLTKGEDTPARIRAAFQLALVREPTDEELRECTAYAKQHGLEVTLHGYLPLDRASPIVSRCKLGLALLQPLPNYVDSYPTKIFDYMALGVPVLCSDFPLYRRLVEETGCGRCVDPTRADLVAEAIAGLLDDPEGLERMGERGRAAVQVKYNWDYQAETLVGFYRDVLGEPSRGE